MKPKITKTVICLFATAVFLLLMWLLFPGLFSENILFFLGLVGGAIGFWLGWILKGLQFDDAWGLAAAIGLAILFSVAGYVYINS